MFVMLSCLLIAGLFGVIWLLTQRREQRQLTFYSQLATLRQLLQLCHQHREKSGLFLAGQSQLNGDIVNMEQRIREHCDALCRLGGAQQRSQFRILTQRLDALFTRWRTFNHRRNLLEHGKLVRQCFYLCDDLLQTWLSEESSASALHARYSQHWQSILDCLDALNQLRLLHPNDEVAHRALKAKIMQTKLYALSLLTPYVMASPTASRVQNQLALLTSPHHHCNERQLLTLANAISQMIFRAYNQITDDVLEHIYLPLPTVVIDSPPAAKHIHR